MMKACAEIPKQLPTGLCQQSLHTRTVAIHRRVFEIKFVSAALIIFAIVPVVSCISGGNDPTRFDGTWTPTRSVSDGGTAQLSLKQIQTLGSADGPIVFGRIGRGAISGDSILVVNDMVACDVVFIRPVSRTLLGRFGQCASGPGGFRAISSLQFYGDTLVVFDGGVRQLIFVEPPGREIYRVTIDPTASILSPVEVYVVDDSSLVVVASVRSGTEDDAGGFLLSLVDRRNGKTIRQVLRPPPVGRGALTPTFSNVTACVASPNDDRRIFVANQWKFQVVSLGLPELRNGTSFERPVSWVRPVSHPNNPNSLLPSTGVFGVACASTFFAVWYSGRMGRHPSAKFPYAHLAIWDYTGNLVFESDKREDSGISLERVLVATENRLFFRGEDSRGIPIVVEYGFRDSDSEIFRAGHR